MDVQVEVDADYDFGREIFGDSPPIPRAGTAATPCDGFTLTVRKVVERRGVEALVTYALVLGMAANIANLVQFATWLCEKLKANRAASLRIEGRAVTPDIDEVVEALQELSRRAGHSEERSAKTVQEMRAAATYLHKRWEYLESCNAEIENHLSDELFKLANSGVPTSDIGRGLFSLNHIIGNTFRYSMLIAVSSLLEESLVAICQLLILDYKSKLGKTKANWFSKHRRLLETEAGICFDPVAEECETIDALVVVRNCLAHAWGRISSCRNAGKLRTIINKYEYFEEYADSHLHVADDAVPTMIWAAEQILDHVLNEATCH